MNLQMLCIQRVTHFIAATLVPGWNRQVVFTRCFHLTPNRKPSMLSLYKSTVINFPRFLLKMYICTSYHTGTQKLWDDSCPKRKKNISLKKTRNIQRIQHPKILVSAPRKDIGWFKKIIIKFKEVISFLSFLSGN